jgi:alkenylglycerophosphocholine/alkenylglycerophosphoethanolamine hydrolase
MNASDTITIVAVVIAAVAMPANWWSRVVGHDRVEVVTKPTATIAIAVAGIVGAGDVSTTALVAAIIAFALCLAGDVALLPAIDRFVVGLASFLAGHLAFVVMFVALGLDEWWLAAAAGVAVTVIGAGLVGRRIVAGAVERDPGLAMPVRAYLAIISVMVVVGWATGIAAAIIGSTLFLLSDSVLGWRQFVASRRWMAPIVMMTYHGALVGLAFSLR